jgi:hypothetical protein
MRIPLPAWCCPQAGAWSPSIRRVLLIAALFFGESLSVRADEPPIATNPLEGVWALKVEGEGTQEFARFTVRVVGGQPIVERVDGPLLRGLSPARGYLAQSPDALVVVLTSGFADVTFKGVSTPDRRAARIEGACQLRLPHPRMTNPVVTTNPARLERAAPAKTEESKTPAPGSATVKGTQPATGKGGLLAALAEQRKAAAITTDPSYAPLELRIAQAALRELRRDATTEERAWAESRLATAARQAGQAQLADARQEQLSKLRALIDREKAAGERPLIPERYPGRRDQSHDRVVLMELFTGAECGPCVAADRAFDALGTAYRPTELITLQYHLHIPRPDPLTSPGSVARHDYYQVRSTPSTFFNGQPLAGSGGPSSWAQSKLNQYRYVIDELLEARTPATIELKARSAGDDAIQIVASAQILAGHPSTPGSTPRLRLAIVEDEVAYLGGNQLPSHHHVVRATPGGREGVLLTEGKGRIETTVRLSDLRKALESYLKDYPASPDSRGPFPRPLPPIELKHLSVVAWVQDDATRDVLHTVLVPVEAKP